MQAIVGLSRGISRALVQGVVQRSQGSTEASQKAGTETDSRLGEITVCLVLLSVYTFSFLFQTITDGTSIFSFQ